jgi:hypothetical protein
MSATAPALYFTVTVPAGHQLSAYIPSIHSDFDRPVIALMRRCDATTCLAATAQSSDITRPAEARRSYVNTSSSAQELIVAIANQNQRNRMLAGPCTSG